MGDTGEVTNNPTETYKNEKYTVKYKAKDQNQEFVFNVDNEGNVEIKEVEWIQNENGEITNGKVTLKIGDYINYDPEDGASVTEYVSPKEKTGNSVDQIFKLSEYIYGWRVFGIENGSIVLISEDLVKPTDVEDYRFYCLGGGIGVVDHSNIIKELNNICAIYGNGKNANGGRCICAEDINNITGYDPKNDYLSYENEFTDKEGKTYKDTYYSYNISDYSDLSYVVEELLIGKHNSSKWFGNQYYFSKYEHRMFYWLTDVVTTVVSDEYARSRTGIYRW